MKKGSKALIIAVAMMLVFCACGGGSKSSEDRQSYSMNTSSDNYGKGFIAAEDSAVYAPDGSGGASFELTSPTEKNNDLTTAAGNLWDNTKIIYRATVNLQSTEFEETSQLLLKMTSEAGGYIEKQYVNNGSYYSSKSAPMRSASFTIRVPSEKFSSFLAGLNENCHVVYINQSSEDIGEQYFNTEQRLETLKNKHARLEDLLSKAEKMADIISLEEALSDTEYEINRLTSTLNRYDSLVGFSTVNVELMEVARPDIAVTEDPGFFERLGINFKNGMARFGETLEDFAMWASYNVIGIIIFVVIVIVLVKVKPFAKLRKRHESRSERKAAKAEEKAAE